MSIFDLLFIALFLVALASILAALAFALAGRKDRARRIAIRLLLGAALYMATVVIASLFLPQHIIAVNEPLCFDDWCIAVNGFERTPAADAVNYQVDIKVLSRAKRVTQRENNLDVYLTDQRGRRYHAFSNSKDIPFNVTLEPGQSVDVTRLFQVPADAGAVDFAITHRGGFPITWFIIGYDTWFRKPPIVRLAGHG